MEQKNHRNGDERNQRGTRELSEGHPVVGCSCGSADGAERIARAAASRHLSIQVLHERAVRAALRVERLGRRLDLVDDLDDRILELVARMPSIRSDEWRLEVVAEARRRLRLAGEASAPSIDLELEPGLVLQSPSSVLDDEQLVAGGQGRSAQEIEDDALGSMAVVTWAFAGACVVAVLVGVGRVVGWC